jgi:AraC-like DNA-binding protein
VLLFWWAGRGERSTPDGILPVGPGVCHWSRPGFDYACTQEVIAPLGVTVIPFHLRHRRGAALTASDLNLSGENLRVLQPDLADSVTRLVVEVAEDIRLRPTAPLPGRPEAAAALFRGLLMQLVADTEALERPPQAVDGAPAYIREHLAGVLDVGALAQQFGCSRSHFTRLFTALTGVSPHQYVLHARITLAQELLAHTSLTVGEVATETGFSSIHHFCRQFRQRTGITPTAWRDGRERPEAPHPAEDGPDRLPLI